MLATETWRCSAKSCGRLLDLQESSHNTHTPQRSAGPINADREGRVEERRDGWLRQRRRGRQREIDGEKERGEASSMQICVVAALGQQSMEDN